MDNSGEKKKKTKKRTKKVMDKKPIETSENNNIKDEDEDEDLIPTPSIHVINSSTGIKKKGDIKPILDSQSSDDDDDDDGKRPEEKKTSQQQQEPLVKKQVLSAEEKKKRNQDKDLRTIFVGNLPSSTANRELRKHFKSCGDIESVRLRGFVPEKLSLPKKVAAIK